MYAHMKTKHSVDPQASKKRGRPKEAKGSNYRFD
jgi:hypothetical protein